MAMTTTIRNHPHIFIITSISLTTNPLSKQILWYQHPLDYLNGHWQGLIDWQVSKATDWTTLWVTMILQNQLMKCGSIFLYSILTPVPLIQVLKECSVLDQQWQRICIMLACQMNMLSNPSNKPKHIPPCVFWTL